MTDVPDAAQPAPIPPHHLTRREWLVAGAGAAVSEQSRNKSVTQMVTWGAPLNAAKKPALVAYLSEQFGVRAAVPPARPAP